MTDTSLKGPPSWTDATAIRQRRRRHAADRRLRIYGIGAIAAAIGLLGILVVTLAIGGRQAFVQTHITMEFQIPATVDPANPAGTNWLAVATDAMRPYFPAGTAVGQVRGILSSNTQFFVRDAVLADPSVIGRTLTLNIPAHDRFDQLNKGEFQRDNPLLTPPQLAAWDTLVAEGRVSKPFNWGLLFNTDSRFPELAGLKGAIIGSAYALLVCFLIAFPVGIAAAIYLEEFARKNRWTDLIEVNINNLAAVPSIVFGLLGLAVFLNYFGLPRSAPLVGGMVLALMTLPTIIIVTRAALKSVPPSIREAAFGIGASRHQVVLHHVLPLAMPGILTGTIIGLAQALGETAPLLLIGMNAFMTTAPTAVTDAATALPTQIFIWADSPERGFVARTSAAILVLLGFLIIMNGIAVFLRQRLERTW